VVPIPDHCGIATIIHPTARLRAEAMALDASVFGLTVTDIVSFILDGIAAVSAYVALHARVASPFLSARRHTHQNRSRPNQWSS